MKSLDDGEFFANAAERRRAYRHLLLTDHGFLRLLWTHEYEIAPGVFRSNQPGPRRLAKLAGRGFKSVLLLRGQGKRDPLIHLEMEACKRLGLTLHSAPISGTRLTPRNRLLELIDTFKLMEKPFVIHCKSGIDRTGLASFLYLLAETDTPPAIARRQLSFRYLHLRHSRHGVLDAMADAYLDAFRASGIGIRDWIAEIYDIELIKARHGSRATAC